jgi:hypothetical protein
MGAVPLDDVEHCQVVAATRTANTNPLIAALVRSAEELLAGATDDTALPA